MNAIFPKINVEDTFDQVVRDYGGVVLKETLPKSPSFNNADYVFHFEKVVAELKCLTEDNVNSVNNQTKVQKVIKQWYDEGKIKTTEIDESTWQGVPKELAKRIYEIRTQSIRGRIKKANIQIRETKQELKLDDYIGLLILANDGIVSLPPAAFIHAAQLALARHFREITHFIYLTANLFTHLRQTSKPTLFFIDVDMERGHKVDGHFIDRLGRNWRRLVCIKMRITAIEQQMDDIEGFWKARHIID